MVDHERKTPKLLSWMNQADSEPKNSETEEEDVKEDESDHNKERYIFEDDDNDGEFDDLIECVLRLSEHYGLRGNERTSEWKTQRRIRVKDIVKEVEDHLKTYSSAVMDISWPMTSRFKAWNDENAMDKDADLSLKVEQGFGPDGLGILSISDVPGYVSLRQNLLNLAPRLASLPEDVLKELEDPRSSYKK
nr:2-oxoglutarate and Fe(II)-dependent oxygenase superfamily protein isoform 1 [Tanacetum cinerariifolium]